MAEPMMKAVPIPFPEAFVPNPRYYRDPLYFVSEKSTPKDLVPYHDHNFIQLWYVVQGSFMHECGGIRFLHTAGDLLVVPPFQPHMFDCRNRTELVCYHCEFSERFLDLFQQGAEKVTLFNLVYLRPLVKASDQSTLLLSLTGEKRELLEYLLDGITREYNLRKDESELISNSYLRALIIRLLTLISREHASLISQEENLLYEKYRTAIQEALDFIDTHYTQAITLPQVSRIALMSISSFSAVFKQMTGRTFVEHVQYLRIREAKILLETTSMTAADICRSTGFQDPVYFGRVFKRATGLSPGAYRSWNSGQSRCAQQPACSDPPGTPPSSGPNGPDIQDA